MKLRTLILAGTALAAITSSASAAEELYFINCGGEEEGQVPVFKEHIAAWEEANPEFTVRLEFLPWGQCQEKALTLAAAGDPPAIAYMGSRTLRQLAANEMILPIELSDEELGTYEDSVISTVQFDGEVWGLPRAFSTKALYFNKTLFEEAGLDMPEGPETWEEMIEAAKAVTENTDAVGFGMPAASFDNTMHEWLNFLYSNGGYVLNEEGEIDFNNPATVETLQLYADLAPYSQEGPIAYDRAKLEPLFENGQIAMYTSGAWGRQKVGDIDYGIAPIPAGPNGEHSTLLITDSLVVFKGSGVEEASMDLIKFLTTPERQSVYDIDGGWTPIRRTQDTEDLIAEDPTWKFFIDAVPAGGPEPLLSDYIGMQDIINEAIQGVVLGEVTAEEAAENAQEELEGLSEN